MKTFWKKSIKNKKNVISVSKIPKEYLADFDEGVRLGSLDYVTKHDEDYRVNANATPTGPIVQESSGRFIWTDDGKGKPGKVLKTPSYSSHSIGFDSDSAVYKKAFTILAGTPSKAVKDIQTMFSGLSKKMDKLDFAEACYKIEKEGKNPSMHPRDVVMDYLSGILNNLGKATGISSIKVEEEPIVKNKKPLRFVT